MRGVRETDKEIKRLSKLICETIRTQRVTIHSACESNGVSYTTFNKWSTEFVEIGTAIKNALKEQKRLYLTGLVAKAETALEKLVTGYEVTETHQEAELQKDGTDKGKVIPLRVKKITKHIAPNPVATIFALTNADPENYKHMRHHELTGKDGKPIEVISANLAELPVEVLFELKHGRKPSKNELKILP